MIRSKYLREGGVEAFDWVARLALNKATSSPTLEPRVVELVAQDLREKGLNVPLNVIQAFAKQSIADLPSLLEAFGGEDGIMNKMNLPGVAQTAQGKVIREGFTGRKATLTSLTWQLLYPTEGRLLLGDVGALAQAKGESLLQPGLVFNVETHSRLAIPISSTSLLVGSSLPELHPWQPSAAEINEASAELSREFFVSSGRGEVEERLHSRIGVRGNYLLAQAQEELGQGEALPNAAPAAPASTRPITAAAAGPPAAVPVELVTVAPTQSLGLRRVAVTDTLVSYPYTVEIPSDWQVHQGTFPKPTLWLAPPAVMLGDPDGIGVVAGTAALANPEQVAMNVQRNQKGIKTAVVKEIDGVRGVLSEFDQGVYTVLALMLPTSTGSVMFMGQSPRAQFAAHRTQYEQILFSVRRAP